MAAGSSDPRAADVEEDASQLVFPKGTSGDGEGPGSGGGWRPAAAAWEGTSLTERLRGAAQCPGPYSSYSALSVRNQDSK